MTRVRHMTLVIALMATGALCRAGSFTYIECWATGTLTTGEDFESWRIHVVVPYPDDWVGSGIDGYLTGGPTWYLDWVWGGPPDPDFFPTCPDSEFGYYYTTPHFYPNSDITDGTSMGSTADGFQRPTHVHLSTWFDLTYDTDGDYVVWQGTVINPTPEIYGRIEFDYVTRLEPISHDTIFIIPEPATAGLLMGVRLLGRRR